MKKSSAQHPVPVLFLFTSLPVGGAENLLLSVIKLVDKRYVTPVVCCISNKGQIGEEIEKLEVPVIVLNKLKKGGFDYKIITILKSLIHEHNIKLVHTNLYHANLYGRIAAYMCNIPTVASVYNTYGSKPSWHKRFVNRILSPLCKSIIVVSKEIRDDITKWDGVPFEKVKIFPSAVDFSMSESDLSIKEAKAKLGIDNSVFVVGTIGRLEEQKGHIYLISAINLLLKKGKNIELILVGDGRLRGQLEQQAHDLEIFNKVHFLGTRRDLKDLYRAMNVFVMSSLWDGLSLVLLSAMAAKVPILATDVGNAAELIGDDEFGGLVNSADASALSSSLVDFIDNPSSYKGMINKSNIMVRARYGEETFVYSLIDLFSSILNIPLRDKGEK